MSFTTPEQYQQFWDNVPEVPYKDPQLDSVITEQDGQNYINVLGSFAPPPPAEGAATEAKQDVQIAQITAAQDGTSPVYVTADPATPVPTKDVNIPNAQDGSAPFYVTADPATPVPTTDKNIPLAQDGSAPFYVVGSLGEVATAAKQDTGNSYLGTINVNTSAVATNTSNTYSSVQLLVTNTLGVQLKSPGFGFTPTGAFTALFVIDSVTGTRVNYDSVAGWSISGGAGVTNLEQFVLPAMSIDAIMQFAGNPKRATLLGGASRSIIIAAGYPNPCYIYYMN